MKLLPALVILVTATLLPSIAPAKTPNEMTVLDCYLQLPKDFLASAPSHWLAQCRVVDEKNGYMYCVGDEVAQPNFFVALFRYPDGHPMLAVCQGQLGGNASRFLDFFELNSQGRMQPLPRTIFPVADGDQNEGREWFFELPRDGHSIKVHDLNGVVRRKITWTGAKFVEEK